MIQLMHVKTGQYVGVNTDLVSETEISASAVEVKEKGRCATTSMLVSVLCPLVLPR